MYEVLTSFLRNKTEEILKKLQLATDYVNAKGRSTWRHKKHKSNTVGLNNTSHMTAKS